MDGRRRQERQVPVFKDPAGRFELEYPEKDWKRLPSGGSSLVVFARNDGPTLFVDHVTLSRSR